MRAAVPQVPAVALVSYMHPRRTRQCGLAGLQKSSQKGGVRVPAKRLIGRVVAFIFFSSTLCRVPALVEVRTTAIRALAARDSDGVARQTRQGIRRSEKEEAAGVAVAGGYAGGACVRIVDGV